MKNEKNCMGFLLHKIGQILKPFSRGLKVEQKPLFSEECLCIIVVQCHDMIKKIKRGLSNCYCVVVNMYFNYLLLVFSSTITVTQTL